MSEIGKVVISEVMTPNVQIVERTATVRQAVQKMRQFGTSSLVVERRDETDEFGIVGVADIASEVIGQNRSPDRVNVYEIMTKPVLSLPAEMQVTYAVRLLTRFQLSRALVIDHERRPVGIVTLRDMVLRTIDDE